MQKPAAGDGPWRGSSWKSIPGRWEAAVIAPAIAPERAEMTDIFREAIWLYAEAEAFRPPPLR
jgi:hypothetical protein